MKLKLAYKKNKKVGKVEHFMKKLDNKLKHYRLNNKVNKNKKVCWVGGTVG